MSRWVVVTGTGRGLGRALVRRLVERGWSVIGCTRSSKSLESLQEEFASPHHFAQVDVADDSQVAAWAEAHLREGRVPELLVNNAAVINENAVLWEVPVDAFHRLMEVNVHGTFHVLRHWLPAMVERRQGVIVNFSSTWGRTTSPQVAPYCASKFAVEGLTQALAQELPRGMAAVALNPGVINTDMLQTCFGAGAAMYPDPESWSHRAVDFLLKLDATSNGQSVSVP